VIVMVILTHPIGRVAGPVWLGVGLIGYYFYRRKRGLPFRGSRARDWPARQLEVYEESGEVELAEEYRRALAHSRRRGMPW
jgi:APA family basic amino acid/polyamine antiporter